VGTEGGFLEQWPIVEQEKAEAPAKVYPCHPNSRQGISCILDIKTSNHLIWGDSSQKAVPFEERKIKMIATAARNTPEIRLWKFDLETLMLEPHTRIETSMTDGINFLIEVSEIQLVAIDTT
jgi:hypothetical protein